VKVTIDIDLADKIVSKALAEAIELTYSAIIELEGQEDLPQYKIRDLIYDKNTLVHLIAAYSYFNIDGDQYDKYK